MSGSHSALEVRDDGAAAVGVLQERVGRVDAGVDDRDRDALAVERRCRWRRSGWLPPRRRGWRCWRSGEVAEAFDRLRCPRRRSPALAADRVTWRGWPSATTTPIRSNVRSCASRWPRRPGGPRRCRCRAPAPSSAGQSRSCRARKSETSARSAAGAVACPAAGAVARREGGAGGEHARCAGQQGLNLDVVLPRGRGCPHNGGAAPGPAPPGSPAASHGCGNPMASTRTMGA